MTDPGHQSARNYSWPPVERGQVGAAHIATQHGAWSPALRDPVAQAGFDRIMAGIPEQLRDKPLIVAEARDLSQVEAIAQMMWAQMVSRDMAAALDDVTVVEAEETELHKEGRTARKSRSQARRTVALAEQFRRYAGQASNMRERLRRTIAEQSADKPFDLALAFAALDEEETSGR